MPSFHCLRSWSVQKRAWIVCSGVLAVLSTRPSSSTSFEVVGVLLARQRIRAVGAELRCALERERPDAGQAKAEHRPRGGSGCQTPVPRGGGSRSATVGFCSRPSFSALGEHRLRDLLADRDPVVFAGPSGIAAR